MSDEKKTILQTGQDLIKHGGPELTKGEHAAVSVDVDSAHHSVRVSGTVEINKNIDLTGDVEGTKGQGVTGSIGLRVKKS